MRLASEIISRSFENMPSSLPYASNRQIVEDFVRLDDQLRLMTMFRNLNISTAFFANRKNLILIFGQDGEDVNIHTFRYGTDALQALFQFEIDDQSSDIVLVRGDNPDDVRESFKNYFSDASDFVSLIDEGIKNLTQNKVPYVRQFTGTDS